MYLYYTSTVILQVLFYKIISMIFVFKNSVMIFILCGNLYESYFFYKNLYTPKVLTSKSFQVKIENLITIFFSHIDKSSVMAVPCAGALIVANLIIILSRHQSILNLLSVITFFPKSLRINYIKRIYFFNLNLVTVIAGWV